MYVFGDGHEANAPASSLHWFEPPDGAAENANVALVDAVGFAGPEVIVGVGGPEAPDATVTAAITTSTPSRAATTAVLRAALLLLEPLIRTNVSSRSTRGGGAEPQPAPPPVMSPTGQC